jgi:hypothetical protein
MLKVANAQCRDLVSRRLPFKGSNLWGDWEGDIYVVYSYGTHFPLWVYDPSVHQWFGNADRYSVSTSKHRTQSQPITEGVTAIRWYDTDTMKQLTYGGYTSLAANRVLYGRRVA